MQVNNIQSPNFGMALKITPEAVDSLRKASISTLERIDNIGKELAETINVDLELGKNLTPRISTKFASAYLPPFRFTKPTDEFLPFSATWDGTNLSSALTKGNEYKNYLKFESKEAAIKAYRKVTGSDIELDRATTFTKLISDTNKLRIENDNKAHAINVEKSNLVSSLIAKFSGEASIKP